MAPRAAATRQDSTARIFLDTAAELIDAVFLDPATRARHPADRFHFPPAVEWLRIQDVIKLAQERDGSRVSAKAFHNRWPNKDTFVRDAVIHALLYRDGGSSNPDAALPRLSDIGNAALPAEAIRDFCKQFFAQMSRDPRTYLLIHLAPSLSLYDQLKVAVVESISESRELWRHTYHSLLQHLGLTLRPGWTVESFDFALQAMLDGFLMRSRLRATSDSSDLDSDATHFADAVVAFSVGVLASHPDDPDCDVVLNRLLTGGRRTT